MHNFARYMRNNGCGTLPLRSHTLDSLIRHKVSESCCGTQDSYEILIPPLSPFVLNGSPRETFVLLANPPPWWKNVSLPAIVTRKTSTPMHFPRIQKRARYTVLRLQKWRLIGFRDVPGAPPLLPKLIAIVRLNRVEALSFFRQSLMHKCLQF